MDVPDLELVRRAAKDSEAFGLLYERHVRKIYNYIYYRTGDHHDAEDLTARVFQRALRHVGAFQDMGVPFSAWLYRIAHNLVANWHRDRSRRPVVRAGGAYRPDAGRPAPGGPGDGAGGGGGAAASSMRRLPEERQQLLILKFAERLSNAEIGQIMGRTEGAIKSLYHRTLSSLREEVRAQQAAGRGDIA